MATYQFPSGLLTPGAASDDGANGGGLSLGFLVTVSTSGLTATGVRWYAPVAGKTATPYLWSSAGAQLAVGPAVTLAAGWNVLPFTTPVALTSGTTYIPAVFLPANSENYTATGSVWPRSTAQFSVATGAQGRYNYSATPGLASGTPGTADSWFGVDLVATDGTSGGGGAVSGTAAAVSAAFGAVTARRPVSGAAAATSAAVGAVTALRPVAGTAAATSSAFGDVGLARPVSGVAAAASGAFADVGVLAGVAGLAAGTSGAFADVTARRPVAGTADAVSSSFGAVGVQPADSKAVTGTATAVSGSFGAIGVRAAVEGLAAASSGAFGDVRARLAVGGMVVVTSAAAAEVFARLGVAGMAQAVSSAFGAIGGDPDSMRDIDFYVFGPTGNAFDVGPAHGHPFTATIRGSDEMANVLARDAVEFFHWTLAALPDDHGTVEVQIAGSWYALTVSGTDGRLLLAGPDVTDPGAAVKVAASTPTRVRVTDNPEILPRDAGWIIVS